MSTRLLLCACAAAVAAACASKPPLLHPGAKPPLFEAGADVDPRLPRAEPGDDFDRALLDDLVAEAEAKKSDALVVVSHGAIVVERNFANPKAAPLQVGSITKSVVSLAFGMLIADGKLKDVDVPMFTWYPEWSEGPRAQITLRHVLTHTSGLAHNKSVRNGLAQQQDRVRLARSASLVTPPGQVFAFSSTATQLLSGVIEQVAGESADVYLGARVFAPLGIENVSWGKDFANNLDAFGGLVISARDLAVLGQMMLQSGRWNGKQLVPEAWVKQSTSPEITDPPYGFLWWVRATKSGRAFGYYANGYLGQWLVVYPDRQLVAVRLFKGTRRDEEEDRQFGWNEFPVMLERAALVK